MQPNDGCYFVCSFQEIKLIIFNGFDYTFLMASKEEVKKLQEISKLQATRDFKRGIRLCKQFNKKYPNNAEGIAWETYYTYQKDPENNKATAVESMKKANMLGMRNAKVWRISGLLYKDMQEYTKALQCFRQSYSLDSSDFMLLNDIANLDLYERHYNQYLKDTRAIFKNNATPYTITRYATAMAINGMNDVANTFLDAYQKTWKDNNNDDEKMFRSEFCIFRASMYVKAGKYEECISYLDNCDAIIRDKESMLENKLSCFIKLNKKEEAYNCILELLKSYPENGDYFDALEEITPKENIIQELLKIKDQYKSHYAHVRALEIMDINDERFKELLTEHLKPLMMKGAPAVYMTIEEFSKEKLEMAISIIESFDVPISSIPIIHLFKAQFYSFHGEFEKAINEIDLGLKHTPTCYELIAWKARIYAKYGRIQDAVKYGAKLREADPADRNSNLLYVKMLLLNGNRKKAEEEASIFSIDEDGKNLLFETQFNSFYTKSGLSALRDGDVETAKKMYRGIMDNFDAYRKNQFNYLGWCWRKPLALIEMINEINIIEKNNAMGNAVEKLLSLNIKEKKEKESKEIAMRSLNSTANAIAMGCIIFCANKMIIQALKCYVKLIDTPYIYTALPSIKELMKEIKTFPEIVQAIVNEEYKEYTKEAKTIEEIYALVKGYVFIGDYQTAEKLLVNIINNTEIEFKMALDIYVFAKFLSNNDSFTNVICNALKEKYPNFEFDINHEQE